MGGVGLRTIIGNVDVPVIIFMMVMNMYNTISLYTCTCEDWTILDNLQYTCKIMLCVL